MPGMPGLLRGRHSVQLRYRYPLAPILVPCYRTVILGEVTGEIAITRWAGSSSQDPAHPVTIGDIKTGRSSGLLKH